jgi:rubrerythrin
VSYDPRFLAHTVALEEEAMTRYRELADAMETHNNPEVAAFFLRMSEESAKHLAEVQAFSEGEALPNLAAWEFDWPGEAPESASYEALHYRMDLRGAIELALGNERAAEAFYRQAAADAANTNDTNTAALARQFAEEEDEHARRLERRLDALPPSAAWHREDDDPAHVPE